MALKPLGSLTMGGGFQPGGSQLTQKQLLDALAPQLTPKPQASALERLFAVPAAIGSIPDVIYRSAYQGKNPLLTYLDNIAQGFGTTFLGNKREDEMKSTSDILKKAGIFGGNDLGSKVGRTVLGFAGDVLLDPTTYISFGTTGIGKVAAQETGEVLAKKLAQEGIEGLGKQASEQLVEKLAGSGVKDASEYLVKRGLPEAAQFLSEIGKGQTGKEVLKVLGKELTTDPRALFAAKAMTQPLFLGADLGKEGFKRLAPEAYNAVEDTFLKVFKPAGYYEKQGLGQAFEAIKKYSGAQDSEGRRLVAELMPIAKNIQNLPENIQSQFGDLVEGYAKAGDTEGLAKVLSEVKDITGKFGDALRERGIIGTGDYVTPAADSVLEQWGKFVNKNLPEGQQKIFQAALTPAQIQKLQDKGIHTIEDFARLNKGEFYKPQFTDVEKTLEETTGISRQLAGKDPKIRKLDDKLKQFLSKPENKEIVDNVRYFQEVGQRTGKTAIEAMQEYAQSDPSVEPLLQKAQEIQNVVDNYRATKDQLLSKLVDDSTVTKTIKKMDKEISASEADQLARELRMNPLDLRKKLQEAGKLVRQNPAIQEGTTGLTQLATQAVESPESGSLLSKIQLTPDEQKMLSKTGTRPLDKLQDEIEIISRRGPKELGEEGLKRLQEIKAALPVEQQGIVNIPLMAYEGDLKAATEFANKAASIPESLSGLAEEARQMKNVDEFKKQYGYLFNQKQSNYFTGSADQFFNLATETPPKGGPLDQILTKENQALIPPTEVLRQQAADNLKIPENLPFPDNAVNAPAYFPRDVLGFKPDFIQNKFGDNAAEILNDPKVQKELNKEGYISINTLSDVMGKKPNVMQRVTGIQNPTKLLEGADLQRTFKTMAEGAESGVVYNQNAAETFLKGALKSDRAIRAHDFAEQLPSLTDDFGNQLVYKLDEAKKAFGDRIPATMKEFEIQGVGKFVAPKEAHDMLKNYTTKFFSDEGMNDLVKMYDKMMNVWKGSVTGRGLGFVGFNVRNAMGDFTNMLLNGFRDPANIKTGFDVLSFEKTLASDGYEAAVKKYGERVANLYDDAIQNSILKGGSTALEEAVGGPKSGIEIAEKLGFKTKSKDFLDTVNKRWDQITSAGGFFPAREEAFKIAMFADAKDQGLSAAEAAKKAIFSNFDYTDLSATEKNVFKRIIPFYSFMRKNLEFHLVNMAQNPGRYATLRKALDNIKKNLGADMSEEDWASLPDWMKEGLAIPLGKEGDQARVITGFGLPTEALDQTLGSREGLAGIGKFLLQSITPAAKMPLELSTGQNLFTGKPIAEETYGGRYANFPEPIKELLGYKSREVQKKGGGSYTKETVNPFVAYLLGSLPFVSPVSTMYKRVSEVSDSPFNALNLVSGGRVYDRNLEQEKAAREREAMDRLIEYLKIQGYGSDFTGFSMPQADRAELSKLLTQ